MPSTLSILPWACAAALLASAGAAEAVKKIPTGIDSLQECMDTYDKNVLWCHTQPEPSSCIEAMKEQYLECVDRIGKGGSASAVKPKKPYGTKTKLKTRSGS
jgi:hypothetical protein